MNQRTILVIEDEEDTVLFLKDRLELAGYRIVTANNGQDGLEKAQSLRPDLILLDVQLPKMNGYQVCRRLKEDPATHALPIIMVTAKVQKNDRSMGLECGCDDYVSKPFDTEELVERISRILTPRS